MNALALRTNSMPLPTLSLATFGLISTLSFLPSAEASWGLKNCLAQCQFILDGESRFWCEQRCYQSYPSANEGDQGLGEAVMAGAVNVSGRLWDRVQQITPEQKGQMARAGVAVAATAAPKLMLGLAAL